MVFLGELIEGAGSLGSPRCVKDQIEEALVERRRDLFTAVGLVFFDTTSIYFEGNGGESIGQYGHSKDHRPDRRQMIAGIAVDCEGRPLCCQMWPGNTDLDARTVAVAYCKTLWMVETIFRTTKSLLETRPIYHRRDATIRGHVFCSYLALTTNISFNTTFSEVDSDHNGLADWVQKIQPGNGRREQCSLHQRRDRWPHMD